MSFIKNNLVFVICFAIFAVPAYGNGEGKSDFENARSKALKEGKLLFIDFYAKWCGPCKWMDETTFSDQRVLHTLTEDFVSIKIDIDDFEGFELKSRFDVRILPTMIVIDNKGKMILRIEETLAPSKLLDILIDVNRDANPTYVHEPNSNPYDKKDTHFSSTDYHRLQMGVYSNFEGAVTKVEALNEIFIEPIAIITEDNNEMKKQYKVIMGAFKSKYEAVSYKEILKNKFELDSMIY